MHVLACMKNACSDCGGKQTGMQTFMHVCVAGQLKSPLLFTSGPVPMTTPIIELKMYK